jgi:acyl carrier protein
LSQEELAREVRGIIARALQRPVEEVPLTAKLEGGLGVDSMAMPDMATPAEAHLKTVEDVVKLVAAQIEKAESARRAS